MANIGREDSRAVQKRVYACLNRIGLVLNAVQSEEVIGEGKRRKKYEKRFMDQMEVIYNQVGPKMFTDVLFRMMVVPFQNKDSPHIYRVIEFFWDLITDQRWGDGESSLNDSVGSSNNNGTIIGDDETVPMRMLRLCEKHHTDSRPLVRQRLMQTVARIIPGRVQVGKIGRGLQAKLIPMLISRIKDKSEQVRGIAGTVLCSFVDDNVPFQSEIFGALLDHMAHDPEPTVRAKIVSVIKIIEESLDHVVERTGDPNANVRAAAIARVTNDIPLSSLTLQMREAILKANTTEDSPKNIQKGISAMLEHWLRCVENDPCEFLRILNVQKRPKICRTALDNLYNQSPQEAFDKIKGFLLKDKKYPDESLCLESTFLWLYLFERFKDESYVFKKLTIAVDEMIDYIKEYFDVVDVEGELPQAELDIRSWMLGDMLQILSYLPVEEGGRKAILDFLPQLYLKKKLMDVRNSTIGVKLIAASTDIKNENVVIDLVNSVIDSDRPPSYLRRSTRRSLSATLDSIKTEDNVKNMKIKLGSLMHRLKKLERDKRIAVGENDLYKADACQDEIIDIENKVKVLKRSIGEAFLLNVSNNSMAITESQQAEEEDDRWHYSDKTMLIAMSILKTNILMLNKISDFSRTFYEMYVVKVVSKCSDPVVRALALEVMGIVATDYENEVSRTTMFCLTALIRDQLVVKETALKCLYDLVIRYSFEVVSGSEEVKEVLKRVGLIKELPKFPVKPEDPVSTLKSLLMSYIRHHELKMVKVSVAGILKLLFKHEMNSSKIIANFLVSWAIPTHENQVRFKEVGTMIPMYAILGEDEALEVAECLFECLLKIQTKTYSYALCNASDNDEIPPPDADQIINLVVQSTDPSRLTQFQRPYICHEKIANAALEQLRSKDLLTDEKIQFAKLLKVLDLRKCPVESINQMIHILADITETTNRTVGQTLAGFMRYLESLVGEQTRDIGEQNGDMREQNGDIGEQNGDMGEQNGDIGEQNGDMGEQNGDMEQDEDTVDDDDAMSVQSQSS